MKKFLLFVLSVTICVHSALGAVRGENTATRGKSTNVSTSSGTNNAKNTRSLTSRAANKTTVRTASPVSVLMSRSATRNNATKNVATRTSVNRSMTTKKSVTARATTTKSVESTAETKTGAAYEQCKTAFFTCMDQFCELKNDSFRRCSCSDRVFDFQDIMESYQNANERLTEFSENLDIVGLNKEQVVAMKTATEGEDALTEDKSASKLLLQAIMNSITGEDSTVGGKYKNLNSIVISPDMSYAFGMEDSGQVIASYNGSTLYKAVYPKCRDAVQSDCNNASLQRAVNAYLMAVEQDCNTVESALVSQQKALKSGTYQASAMLDLARIENRRNHNSDDVAACLTNVEKAIQSEEVCGANYHKCLDYGQFIDVTTGAPLTGVANFYKLGELLRFNTGKNIQEQKLSSIAENHNFVNFFENKTKKFAASSLDKCTEDSDYVWQQYLDRALLDIYYAQQSKVESIKQSCMDLVAKCYDNQNVAIEKALANLTGESITALNPSIVNLSAELCSDYIESCNGMFAGDIINKYMENKKQVDINASCRAVVQQCFDKFGGTKYNNFYYPQSGLFEKGAALDWFTLYDEQGAIVSSCAQQLKNTIGCSEIIEDVFGGFDKYKTGEGKYVYINGKYDDNNTPTDLARKPRETGVATEMYYKIIDALSNNCNGLNGVFIDYTEAINAGYQKDNFCLIDSDYANESGFGIPQTIDKGSLTYWYHFYDEENMCPANYWVDVDTQSWGVCSCWENGGYRSRNGKLGTCRPLIPAKSGASDESGDSECTNDMLAYGAKWDGPYVVDGVQQWCLQDVKSIYGQLCPTKSLNQEDGTNEVLCAEPVENGQNERPEVIPVVRDYVPYRKK